MVVVAEVLPLIQGQQGGLEVVAAFLVKLVGLVYLVKVQTEVMVLQHVVLGEAVVVQDKRGLMAQVDNKEVKVATDLPTYFAQVLTKQERAVEADEQVQAGQVVEVHQILQEQQTLVEEAVLVM
jgi:hypothetical protein